MATESVASSAAKAEDDTWRESGIEDLLPNVVDFLRPESADWIKEKEHASGNALEAVLYGMEAVGKLIARAAGSNDRLEQDEIRDLGYFVSFNFALARGLHTVYVNAEHVRHEAEIEALKPAAPPAPAPNYGRAYTAAMKRAMREIENATQIAERVKAKRANGHPTMREAAA